MKILAHRGNIEGPQANTENTIAACRRALELGFGLETDLRRTSDGVFYISHDPLSNAQCVPLEEFAPVFRRHPDNVIAVNVKELGYEHELVRLNAERAFGQRAFYFDFELLEPETPGEAQRSITRMPGGVDTPMAARISDRGEPVSRCLEIPSHTVWADEFDDFWIDESVLRPVKEAGRKIYVISPELHGSSRDEMFERWRTILAWGVEGVCTDFALEADEFFNGVQHARLSA